MNQIGVDRWVEQSAARRRRTGWTAPVHRLLGTAPPSWALGIFVLVGATIPFFARPSDVRIGVNVLLLVMLALGLNVVVGWAGLFDLGYLAFYGFGAYFYAIVSSNQLPAHWPTLVAVPVIVAAGAVLGAALSLSSRRLDGDYLAIVTLYFSLIFVELVENFGRLPFVSDDLDLTGGPNGITGVEPWEFFGFSIDTFHRNYYLVLIVTCLMMIGLHNANNSRTGRAWRAVREDALAAAHMTVPVNRVRLLAFAVGAAIAALSGTIFAAVQVGVFPDNFALAPLITVYAAVILGGSGSIPGVVLGAVVVAYTPEVLRDPTKASLLFYTGLILLVRHAVKRWDRVAALAGGVLVFGLMVHVALGPSLKESGAGAAGGSFPARMVDWWMVTPIEKLELITNYAFVGTMFGMVVVATVTGWWRFVALIPTTYLAIFVWENRLVSEPAITRQLLFGGLLVVMIAARPQGLLGERRVTVT